MDLIITIKLLFELEDSDIKLKLSKNDESYFDIVLNSERRMGTMAKRKTLPKDFEQLVEAGNEQEIKNVFERCDINVYGGYNKGNR